MRRSGGATWLRSEAIRLSSRQAPGTYPGRFWRPCPILDKIIAAHRAEAANDRVAFPDELYARAAGGVAESAALYLGIGGGRLAHPPGGHRRDQEALASKGDLDPGLDPPAVAADYKAGWGRLPLGPHRGPGFVGGSPGRPPGRQGSLLIPVLRKDFTVSRSPTCATPSSWAPTPCC